LGTARKIQLILPLKARRTHIQRGSHEIYAHFLPTIFGEDPKLVTTSKDGGFSLCVDQSDKWLVTETLIALMGSK
jgi:hypothetical protein